MGAVFILIPASVCLVHSAAETGPLPGAHNQKKFMSPSPEEEVCPGGGFSLVHSAERQDS